MFDTLHDVLRQRPRQVAEDFLGAVALFAILMVALHMPVVL